MQKNFKTYLQKIAFWYKTKKRWWIPLAAGFLYSICQPPFNHETHWAFFLFPFISFVSVIPMLVFSIEKSFKKSIIKTYLFGITASYTQFYWIENVVVDGLWPLIMCGLMLLTFFFALIYLAYGMLFRYIKKNFNGLHIILFPSVWITIEFIRTLGEMSFPWALSGYSLTPILPIAQLASVTGIYGLSFIVIMGNIIILDLIISVYRNSYKKSGLIIPGIYFMLIAAISVWGAIRINQYHNFKKTTRISLIQSNIDQANWSGKISLDTSMAVTEKLVYTVSKSKPDLIIFPESGLFCYLERQTIQKNQVFHWSRSANAHIILGTLHLERDLNLPYYKYRVYNSVFFLDKNAKKFEHYYKIKLVPFSEALPFEGILPIISRINLGESDFSRGEDETMFSINDLYKVAPFLCYEIIYPDFVRKRVKAGANLLVNLTNDGWFGHSTGPYQHAAMARIRSIENGTSLARCANSGISMLVDPVGRVTCKSNLYERTIITGDIPYCKLNTFYCKFGDWMIWVSLFIISISFVYLFYIKIKQRLTSVSRFS